MNSTVSSPTAPVRRRVSFLLGLGILFVPMIFVWFLLREGHSKRARIIGFTWLVIAILGAVANIQETPTTAVVEEQIANPEPEAQTLPPTTSESATAAIDEPITEPAQSAPPFDMSPAMSEAWLPNATVPIPFYGVTITSKVDSLVITNVVINRGNCFLGGDEQKRVVLGFGEQKTYTRPQGNCKALEVEVTTDQGTWTANF